MKINITYYLELLKLAIKSNPVANKIFEDNHYPTSYGSYGSYTQSNKALSRADVVGASLIGLGVVILVASLVIYYGSQNPALGSMANLIGIIGVFAMGFVAAFSKKVQQGSAPFTIIFAIFEGLMAGGFTFAIGNITTSDGTPGWKLVLTALVATGGLFLFSQLFYASGLIKINQKFKSFVLLATAGMAIMYLGNFLIAMIFGTNLLFGQGPIPIIIALVAIVLACMNLIVNFHNVDTAVQQRAPQQLKWAIGLSFVLDLVWLYMEILRLLYLLNRD